MRFSVMVAVALCLQGTACTTVDEVGVLEQIYQQTAQPPFGSASESVRPDRSEIEAGLRQALQIGSERVIAQIGRIDGFWRDPQIRIALPGRLNEVQTQLSRVGLSGPLDDLQLRMNRAAEKAISESQPLIAETVGSITFADALAILKGGDNAATDWLRVRTEAGLQAIFRPVLDEALQASGAYQRLDQLTASMPQFSGLAEPLKTSLTTHAVDMGLGAFFDYLALEEARIRANPVARSTALLRKVFGSL